LETEKDFGLEAGQSLNFPPQQRSLLFSSPLSALRIRSGVFLFPFRSKCLDEILEVQRNGLVPDRRVVEKVGTDTGLANLHFGAEADEGRRLIVTEVAQTFTHIL